MYEHKSCSRVWLGYHSVNDWSEAVSDPCVYSNVDFLCCRLYCFTTLLFQLLLLLLLLPMCCCLSLPLSSLAHTRSTAGWINIQSDFELNVRLTTTTTAPAITTTTTNTASPQLAQPKHTDTHVRVQHTYIHARHMNEWTKRTNELNIPRVYVCTHMVEKSGKARVFRNFNWMDNMRDAGVYVCCVHHYVCLLSLTLSLYLRCL